MPKSALDFQSSIAISDDTDLEYFHHHLANEGYELRNRKIHSMQQITRTQIKALIDAAVYFEYELLIRCNILPISAERLYEIHIFDRQ